MQRFDTIVIGAAAALEHGAGPADAATEHPVSTFALARLRAP